VYLTTTRLGRAHPGGAVHICGNSILTAALVDQAARYSRHHTRTPGTSCRSNTSCRPDCHASRAADTSFEREQDILDVWFDSGSSHEAVLASGRISAGRLTCTSKARISIAAGSSRRCSSVSARGTGRPIAPFSRTGSCVDEQGHKMSKVARQRRAAAADHERQRADVLRLWVSMVDYRDEVRLGNAVLARTVEAYRKIRNTFRYLISNLYDFDPAKDLLPISRSRRGGSFALARCARVAAKDARRLRRIRFPGDFPALNEFVTVRSQRVLRRRFERPPVYVPRGFARTRSAQTAHTSSPTD
jgi:isoleucyl-tRNA synthetase